MCTDKANMTIQISTVILLVSVCLGYAKDIPTALDGEMCGQCQETLSKIKTQVLTQMESLAPEDRSSAICDLDEPELQEQCYELFEEHGDEFMDLIRNVDEAAMCETICKDVEAIESPDTSLYFQSEKAVTKTDAVGEVGGFACSICQRFMKLIHNYMANRRHQGFIIRLIKGACHFVPIFRSECKLLVDMYGRLIIRLAARYLSPRLCTTLRLCPRQLPSSCADVLKLQKHRPTNGTYRVFNAKKEPFVVHCSFHARHIYTYISSKTTVSIDLSKLFNNKKHTLIRYRNIKGDQYESQLGQIAMYKKTPLSVQYSANVGYTSPVNKRMTPYIFLGFIPKSQSHKGAIQGYNANGKDYTFRNCDGNPNSYFTFLFNHGAHKPVKYGPFDSALMHAWEKTAKAVPRNERIPIEFFSFYEIHFGGCGGYATTQQFRGVTGAALGLRYDMLCDEPEELADGTKTLTNTDVGSTVQYACNQGYAMVLGDARRTCGQDGQWTGVAPTCIRELDMTDMSE